MLNKTPENNPNNNNTSKPGEISFIIIESPTAYRRNSTRRPTAASQRQAQPSSTKVLLRWPRSTPVRVWPRPWSRSARCSIS